MISSGTAAWVMLAGKNAQSAMVRRIQVMAAFMVMVFIVFIVFMVFMVWLAGFARWL